MNFKGIDHLVITTKNLDACLRFYVDILGMKAVKENGRYALFFGSCKFNIHQRKAEFLPVADHPTFGSLDFCLEVDDDLEKIKKDIQKKHYPILEGPVKRHGARGEMDSLYLRDPDGNLVELCQYKEE